jgi:para-aminobenzoate synthetase/4-amino-4-deoxychorismate lyase
MTSTAAADTSVSVCDIRQALFPPASIASARKVRTTEIIAELESTTRGLYTGCIG